MPQALQSTLRGGIDVNRQAGATFGIEATWSPDDQILHPAIRPEYVGIDKDDIKVSYVKQNTHFAPDVPDSNQTMLRVLF